MSKYTPIIGMEVHVELKTKSKMFCSCKNDPDLPKANVNVCEICLGHPGTLPVPNKQAIAWTVLIGKALNCAIRDLSKFDRKHYFYPDLPKAYQISQYDEPIAEHGKMTLHFYLFNENNIRDEAEIGIRRVHLEEDTARLAHDAKGNTLVDFNRAGIPLVEIVTHPDFKTAIEAKKYSQELQTLFRYLGVSDADMEKGHLRCEANVSVQETGKFEIVDGVVKPLADYTLNNKVEVKNLNSFRSVERAIAFEIERQTQLLNEGKTWPQETRGWDETKQETVSQRIKETAADYRYFPEPDIPPFHPEKIAGELSLPELPQAKRARFHDEYFFSYADAQILTDDKAWADFAEDVMSELVDWLHSLPEVKGETDTIKEQKARKIAQLAGGWLTSKLIGAMTERNLGIADLKITPENFAELVALVYASRVNSSNAQKLLAAMLDAGTDMDPTHIMEEKGYGQMTDETQISEAVENVIKGFPDQVDQYKKGKSAVLQFLIGMVMKATEGNADPGVAERLLKDRLEKP
ncbi:MAG: glutaminyl-tRNA synthase (glutamine-hydrolyzing) subunit B [Candidatus Magasanikbacteria bacterium RIFCSPHIGHO2_02_FULL_51_14]|uniref:Aspartyl/glutamyl-tRNA(Asn/Gln) amidotransferase subunit B n=1 Tax=Candidatus Magasanikbacteria bacterium RIFCSPHIGHO2_02_FULL_51_14 TaxID=1798683 RepID=A0A1F6MPX6_9BACT|nr:MAG: glutaminyl-tRNA synthase (glutamine-hydrolyzing) subunit B [Candidatus Magasanikbacteria bacterium RIFCSPHIGHO2_02_FULL_51_14]